MELAIDTSTEYAGVALAREGQLLAETNWRAGQKHSAQLMVRVQTLLEQQGARLEDLKLIVVALGPGSFNGLRTGLATAKGLCFTLALPLVGICTLEVEAYQFAATGLPLCPVHEAGRGDVATALYANQEGRWRCLVEPQVVSRQHLLELAPPQALFCGEVSPALRELLRQAGREAIAQGTASLRRAGLLAELGWQRWRAGHQENLLTVEPLYLRCPSITGPAARER